MNLSLASKVALITGGSRGIGAAAVRMFVLAGAKVAFNYQAAQAQAEDLVRELGAGKCRAIRSDLSTTEAAGKLVSSAIAAFGRLDILVANHGIWPAEDAPIDRMSEEQWQRTIAVNLDSVFALVKHSVRQMKKQGGGHIVLVSSTAGQRGEAFHCDYAATKGALISMVKGLSTELARDNIRVNCVAPGYGHVSGGAERSGNAREDFRRDSAGPRRNAGRDCRTHFVSLHAACGVHYGRGFQFEWRRGAGRVEGSLGHWLLPSFARLDGRGRPSLRDHGQLKWFGMLLIP